MRDAKRIAEGATEMLATDLSLCSSAPGSWWEQLRHAVEGGDIDRVRELEQTSHLAYSGEVVIQIVKWAMDCKQNPTGREEIIRSYTTLLYSAVYLNLSQYFIGSALDEKRRCDRHYRSVVVSLLKAHPHYSHILCSLTMPLSLDGGDFAVLGQTHVLRRWIELRLEADVTLVPQMQAWLVSLLADAIEGGHSETIDYLYSVITERGWPTEMYVSPLCSPLLRAAQVGDRANYERLLPHNEYAYLAPLWAIKGGQEELLNVVSQAPSTHHPVLDLPGHHIHLSSEQILAYRERLGPLAQGNFLFLTLVKWATQGALIRQDKQEEERIVAITAPLPL